MKKTLLTFITIFILITSKQSLSLEKGEWTFVKDVDWCFIGSLPIKSDLSASKKRGDNYILVYKIIGSDENIVQVEAGYKYNLDEKIIVKIDNTPFNFYTTEDSSETAWTEEDKKVIYAMKKGIELVTIGISNKGTKVVDTYSLKGFTAAINKLSTDC